MGHTPHVWLASHLRHHGNATSRLHDWQPVIVHDRMGVAAYQSTVVKGPEGWRDLRGAV
jgi:hypothetical protein